jgi:hypothetical protein
LGAIRDAAAGHVQGSRHPCSRNYCVESRGGGVEEKAVIYSKERKLNIIDNVLSEQELRELQHLMIYSNAFPWYYLSYVNSERDTKNYFQFTHNFYSEFSPMSTHFSRLNNLILKLNPKAILRIKANLLTVTSEIVEHGFHHDEVPSPQMKVAVFYLNTNNGHTKFDDGQCVKSVENRLVIFDSDIKHTGSSCTDENLRVVINFNYFLVDG